MTDNYYNDNFNKNRKKKIKKYYDEYFTGHRDTNFNSYYNSQLNKLKKNYLSENKEIPPSLIPELQEKARNNANKIIEDESNNYAMHKAVEEEGKESMLKITNKYRNNNKKIAPTNEPNRRIQFNNWFNGTERDGVPYSLRPSSAKIVKNIKEPDVRPSTSPARLRGYSPELKKNQQKEQRKENLKQKTEKKKLELTNEEKNVSQFLNETKSAVETQEEAANILKKFNDTNDTNKNKAKDKFERNKVFQYRIDRKRKNLNIGKQEYNLLKLEQQLESVSNLPSPSVVPVAMSVPQEYNLLKLETELVMPPLPPENQKYNLSKDYILVEIGRASCRERVYA
jgi:hypothetical protein